MAIDPLHVPILGDPVSDDDAPVEIRAACALLVTYATLTLVYQAFTGPDASVYLLPTILTAGFAATMVAGHRWARGTAVITATMMLALTLIGATTTDLAVTALGATALTCAVFLCYRPRASAYLSSASEDSLSG